MNLSNYRYQIKDHSGRNIIIIEDPKTGMTVTHVIKELVEFIEKKEKIDARWYMIIYKDTNDLWNGWNQHQKAFIALSGSTWPQAVDVWIKYQLEPKNNRS